MNARYLVLGPVRESVRAHAPRCATCSQFHNVDTALADWLSGALSFRHADGYLLHGELCAHSAAIVARYGANARLHEAAAAIDEGQANG